MKPEGYVYLIRSETNFWKIGRTVNPEDRMRTFKTKLPFDVEYEHLIACYDQRLLELQLHRQFDGKRQRGEWFSLDPNDVAYIKRFSTQLDYEVDNGYRPKPTVSIAAQINPARLILPSLPDPVNHTVSDNARMVIAPLLYPIMYRVVFAVVFMLTTWTSYLVVIKSTSDWFAVLYIVYTVVSAMSSVMLVGEVWLLLRRSMKPMPAVTDTTQAHDVEAQVK